MLDSEAGLGGEIGKGCDWGYLIFMIGLFDGF